jgi:hypothetical protein
VTGAKAPRGDDHPAEPEAQFRQFLSRARSGEYENWWDKRETVRRVKRKLRGGLLKLFRRPPKFLKEGHLTLLSVYASDERLNTWTRAFSKACGRSATMCGSFM